MPENQKGKIMSTRRSITDRVSAKREQIEQMINDLKRLEQEEKQIERKARTKRLCERAGFLESILPETIELTAKSFEAFVKSHVANSYGKSAIKRLIANPADEDEAVGETESSSSAQTVISHQPQKPQQTQTTTTHHQKTSHNQASSTQLPKAPPSKYIDDDEDERDAS